MYFFENPSIAYFVPYLFLVYLSIWNKGKLSNLTAIFIWIFLLIFIGFRYQVGADYFNYAEWVFQAKTLSYSELLFRAIPPGYALLLKICANYNLGESGLNFLNAAIFSTGLIYFCSKLKNPFLGLIASYPYLIVVVAMGYVTHATAIGIQLVGLTFYQSKKFKSFYLSIFLALMFHKSAFLSLLIPLFDRIRFIKRKSSLISLSLLTFGFGIVYFRYISGVITAYTNFYFAREYSAEGAFIKLLILFIFAIIFLINRNKFELTVQQKNLLFSLSIASIFILLSNFFVKSSVATYRISLYFYSLILFVTSYLPYTNFLNISEKNWKMLIYIYNFLILCGWLVFSNHSRGWIPYKNILFQGFF